MKKRVKHCIESCRFIHLFLCFVLVSGECSAFALFRTVVKLIMLHYSCFARKNVQLQALFCRLQNVIIIISKKVIQHLRASNKNGSPCICFLKLFRDFWKKLVDRPKISRKTESVPNLYTCIFKLKSSWNARIIMATLHFLS